jgi:sulfatase modifying factor 1
MSSKLRNIRTLLLTNSLLTTSLLATSVLLAACGEGDTEKVIGTGDCPGEGGTMNRMPEGFCIDNTEVTREVYFAWLETEPAIDAQSAECASNDDFMPTCLTTGGWGLDRFLENPVGCVDRCDAQTFCEAHGKRLCGVIGGGPNPLDAYKDPTASEWFASCSAGGENDYVFGNEYILNACYETLRETWGSTEAGGFEDCVSPNSDYTGLYDMGGNLAEWEDSCDGDGGDARCRIRGGSFQHEGNGIRCDAGSTLTFPRTGTSDAVGFRCCAD